MLQKAACKVRIPNVQQLQSEKGSNLHSFSFLDLGSAMVICSAADGCHYVVGTDGTRSLGKILGGPGGGGICFCK